MKQKLNCILIIDDDEPTTFFTHMMLEESGCTNHIQIAHGGQEALTYLIKSEAGNNTNCPVPDLIFLDINMPAMDGWEFLEEYKKLHTSHKVNVIMLTTSLFPEDKLKAAEIPEISGFEHKPITPEKIISLVKNIFSESATH